MTNSARLCLLVAAMMAALIAPAACAAPPVLTATVIQTGLSRPWDVAFLPDGRMVVSERRGNILIFQSPDPAASLLATIPLEGVHAETEAGAMGIAIDPGFTTNGFLYLCVSRDDELEWRNQVLRYVVSENTLTFDSFVIRRGILASFTHNGCRVRFGPDGKLWVDEMPAVPLYQQVDLYGVSKRLNWKARSDEVLQAYTMSLKDGK